MGDSPAGLRWQEFELEAEEVATQIAEVIEQHRFALAGTIRRDGSPRISPVETHFVRGDLVLVMLPGTRKADDIRRDNRITLQSPIMNAAEPGREYKLRGRAATIDRAEARERVADAVEAYGGWRPRHAWLFLAVHLLEAVHLTWATDGSATMASWNMRTRATTMRQLRLDWQRGGYAAD